MWKYTKETFFMGIYISPWEPNLWHWAYFIFRWPWWYWCCKDCRTHSCHCCLCHCHCYHYSSETKYGNRPTSTCITVIYTICIAEDCAWKLKSYQYPSALHTSKHILLIVTHVFAACKVCMYPLQFNWWTIPVMEICC